ncbi:TPA: hypothetical protein HA225_04550 [Candidatus Micrarchaeota archaeon]|nr:hypothetical protein [Candidatus Micrarchaeota archaeon]HIH30176.1 hypothetical protein [Candidatus Micrarchaeota archaeon]
MKSCPPGKEFVFKMPDGRVIGRAKSVPELSSLIKTAPLDAVLYHAKGGHYAPWLNMLQESAIVEKLKSIQINDKTIRVALLRALHRV